jgi:hypothetical protein
MQFTRNWLFKTDFHICKKKKRQGDHNFKHYFFYIHPIVFLTTVMIKYLSNTSNTSLVNDKYRLVLVINKC